VGEQVAYEGFHVGVGGGLDGGVAGAQEGASLAEADQVGGDGALGAVLGEQVPLEGADERVRAGWSMIRNVRKVKRSPSDTWPVRLAPDMKMTSVSAAHGVWWACEDLNLGPLPYEIPGGITAM
jgi:hypothetical protein